MMNLLLKNKLIDVNQSDSLGVNAFWMAAFKGQVEVSSFYSEAMRVLSK